MARKIFAALDIPPAEQAKFLSSLAETIRAKGLQRIDPLLKKLSHEPKPAAELSIDLFRVIADWYHSAILELTFEKNFKADPRWISQELDISITEAKLALERLLKLGLLEEKSGRVSKSQERFTTADKHLTNAALKRNQKQILEKAIYSLENDPIEERSHSSMTMAIDPKNLPAAKKLISQFNRSLCDLLESGEQQRVYNLGISLYPVQKKNKSDQNKEKEV
jgi:uncharacterized protein (TIGR02147 family)